MPLFGADSLREAVRVYNLASRVTRGQARGGEKSVNANRTVTLICSGLLAAAPLFARGLNGPTFPAPNAAAHVHVWPVSPVWEVPQSWKAALSLPDDLSQADANGQAATPFLHETLKPSAILESESLDALFPLNPLDGAAQQQTQPNPGNEPSLEGLGFPASAIQGSAREQALLNKRSHMLQIHQKLGLIAAIPMVAAIFTGMGAKGHHGLPGSPTGRDVHAGLGILTTGLYFSSAYFAIRAPKIPGTKSYGLIRLHKAMAWIHGPGMIITPILGSIAFSQLSRGERVHGIAKYHAWAAYTTAAAYGVAILSVTFK